MKSAKKYWRLLFLIVTFGILTVGCSSKKDSLRVYNELTAVGNMRNLGFVIELDETRCCISWYQSTDLNERLYATVYIHHQDTGENEKLISNVYNCYVAVAGWLYYEDDEGLQRINIDTREKEKLADFGCSELIVSNDLIYFTRLDGEPGIFSMGLNGGNIEKIYDGYGTSLCPAEEKLYFVGQGGMILEMDTTDFRVSKVPLDIDDSVRECYVVGNSIYLQRGDLRVYKAKLNENKCTVIFQSEFPISSINIMNDKLLVAMYDEKWIPTINSYDLETGKIDVIADIFANHLFVSGDVLYFLSEGTLFEQQSNGAFVPIKF